jgi:curli biogenesis system outer membrane secretion channel CsgG
MTHDPILPLGVITMILQHHFRTLFIIPIMLLAISTPANAGNYETEMTNMADAISTSFDQQQVKTIAVLDFTDLQGTVTELGRFLAEELSTNLVTGKKKFDVIDRANLSRLLDENKLSRSGLVDPENIKRLGKIAGVDALIIGTVTPLGKSLRVTAKVINTESAKIVGAARGDVEKTPEISELLRTRVIDTRAAQTTGSAQQPTSKAVASSPKKVKLTHESKLFRAAVDTVSFDKSSNQMTVFIDFTNPSKGPEGVLCLAGAGNDSVIAIDDFSGQWNLVRMVGLRNGMLPSDSPKSNSYRESMEYETERGNSYVLIRAGDSHRFAIVLAPAKSDSSLTLDITLELYLSSISAANDNFVVSGCGSSSNSPERVSVGFKGVTVTQ